MKLYGTVTLYENYDVWVIMIHDHNSDEHSTSWWCHLHIYLACVWELMQLRNVWNTSWVTIRFGIKEVSSLNSLLCASFKEYTRTIRLCVLCHSYGIKCLVNIGNWYPEIRGHLIGLSEVWRVQLCNSLLGNFHHFHIYIMKLAKLELTNL